MINQSRRFKAIFYTSKNIVKNTILLTLITTFVSLTCQPLFTKVFQVRSLDSLLSLSTWGIHRCLIWQFFSYLFVYPALPGGICMGLLFQIFFNMSLLWTTGSAIVARKGKRHFIGLYFGGGLFVALIAYLFLFFSNSSLPFAGPTHSIDILLIGCAFLFPNAPMSFFFLAPVPIKWLVFGFIGVHLLLDFSNGNFFSFFASASALLYGYSYSVLVWESLSPFPRLHVFEKKIIYFKRKCFFHFARMFDRKSPLLKMDRLKRSRITVQNDDVVDV